MSDELRRALAEAAASPPPVQDWLTPVRQGVRRRRQRRAVTAAAGTSVLVVAGVLAGLALLPAPGPAEVLLPPPVPTARPTASPAPLPQRTPPPPPVPSASARVPSRDEPGPVVPAVPQAPRVPEDLGRTAPPRPAASSTTPASPRPTRAGSPAARPSATPTPSPTPTAGAQDITLSWTPQERTLPAGQEVEVVVTARGSAERPAFVQALRVDGEPVEQDAPRTCTAPTARPERTPQQAVRRFTVVLTPGEHVLEAVADDDCSWYRGRARASWTVTAS